MMFAGSHFWQADKEMKKNGEGDEADFSVLKQRTRVMYPSNPQDVLVGSFWFLPVGERFFHKM